MNKSVIKYFRDNISNVVYLLFLLMVLGAFFEVIGVSLFIPLLSDKNDLHFINSFFSLFTLEYSNVNLAIFIIGIFIIKFGVLNLQNYLIYKTSYKFMYSIKKKIMDGLYRIEYKGYNIIGVDTLNNIFTKEIEKSSLSIRYLLQLGVNLIYSIAYLIFALCINVRVVVICLFIGVLVIAFQKIITKTIIIYSKKIVEGNTKTNLIVLQILESMKYIKSTNSYAFNDKIFDQISIAYSKDSERMSFLNSIPKNTPEIVGVLSISFIIIINELTIKEDVITIVFLGLLLYRTLVKILSVQNSYQDFLINIGAINKIIEILEYIYTHQEVPNKENSYECNKIERLQLKNIEINLSNKKILNGINIDAKKGYIYAIVGESGSGKTTLLNTLTALYSPQNGEMFVNGRSDIEWSCYRQKIGYVSQETVIFDGSIKENILFGKPLFDTKYSELVHALGIDKIDAMYLTMGGNNISGGQRQLVALARELYKEPEILILDEFTSALDSFTEKKVIEYIERIKTNKIIFIVAHRLSSIKNTDKVYFLKNGYVLDNEEFHALYSKNLEFRLMCNNQNIFLES